MNYQVNNKFLFRHQDQVSKKNINKFTHILKIRPDFNIIYHTKFIIVFRLGLDMGHKRQAASLQTANEVCKTRH